MHKQVNHMARWGSRKRVLLLVLFFSILLRAFSLYQFTGQNNRLEEEYAKSLQQIEQKETFEKLNHSISTAGLAIRGYVLSGDQKFIDNFSQAMDSIPALQNRFHALQQAKQNTVDKTSFLTYDEWVSKKMALIQRLKQLSSTNSHGEAMTLIAAEDGLRSTDNIVKVNTEILQERIQRSQQLFLKDNNSSNGLAYASFGAAVFLILVIFYLLAMEIRDRKKINDQLSEQKESYSITLNSLGEGLITTDEAGQILYMNTSAERLTGWTNDEAQNLPLHKVYDVVNEETGKPFEHIVSRILKNGQPVQFENNTFLLTKNRNKSIISNSGYPLFDADGIISGTVLLFNDITASKQIENQLKQTEEKYSNLVEQAADGIFLFDQQGNFLSANLSGCMALGYTKTEMLTLNLKDITPEKYLSKKPLNLPKLSSGTPLLIERQFVRKDGTAFFTEVSVQLTANGNIQAIVRDITDRKNAEAKTLKAIELYDILSEATSDTIWDWDIIHNKVTYNANITKMFGFQISEVENIVEWWKKNIHPDDLQTVAESVDEMFNKKLQNFQLAYRFRCEDGSYKYIYDRAFAIYDEQNKPIRMIGAMQDVSYEREEEKRIAKAIIDAQEKERLYIGQELHDNVNQILAGSLLSLNMAKEKRMDRQKAIELIEVSKAHIMDAINEVRKLSHELAPASFNDVSLKDIFETLLSGINVNNQFTINLQFDPLLNVSVKDNIQINLYRILQEAVKNILNYSEATTIDISVTLLDNIIRMRTADNGKGFDTKKIKGGIGLNNIKKRVEALSGKFILHSGAGKGCEIIVEIPSQDEE